MHVDVVVVDDDLTADSGALGIDNLIGGMEVDRKPEWVAASRVVVNTYLLFPQMKQLSA